VLSSIQLHVSFDHDDKATGALRFLHEVFNVDPTRARYEFAFIGDSENDAACFAAFHTSIGVQNLVGRPTLTPRYVTTRPRGLGFSEAADVLIAMRRASPTEARTEFS
jgi:hypothetical protein